MNHLSYVIYYVKEVTNTAAFFEKAFGIQTKFIHESKTYAEMDTGATTLAFAQEDFVKEELPGGFHPLSFDKPFATEISFTSSDPKKALEKALSAGCTPVTPLEEKPWGQTMAYVKTPDGILVLIASKMG